MKLSSLMIPILWAVLLGLPLTSRADGTPGTTCAESPSAAVAAFEGGAKLTGNDGYRVAAVRRDAVLGINWAAVERCGHSAWPTVAVPTRMAPVPTPLEIAAARAGGRPVAGLPERRPLVRVGQTVRLWQEERFVRFQLAAVSEENGAAGDRVRLHMGISQPGGDTVRTVFGLVRGPGDVEMER